MRWFLLTVSLLLVGALTLVALPHSRQSAKIEQPSTTPSAERSSGAAVRFLVVGDNHGVNATYEAALERAVDAHADFVLNLADLTEHGTVEEFDAVKELEGRFAVPVLHVVGAHDIKADATRATFTERFQPQWYSRNVGPLHLVVLDNADRLVGFPQEELDWLEADLAANTQPVTVLAYHRPFGYPLADVVGDDETPASRRSNDAFLAILARHPVERIYTAHLHTHLTYTMGDTTVVISGGGGDPAQAVLGGPDQSFFHALIVDVNAEGLDSSLVALPAP